MPCLRHYCSYAREIKIGHCYFAAACIHAVQYDRACNLAICRTVMTTRLLMNNGMEDKRQIIRRTAEMCIRSLHRKV